ncbi:peptidase S8 [Sphingomonas paeninsulae]|jgi:hypothetical protein|uniref:Peptidase S8 n=1 Tax=Sphingomonas paeninsulae TaxID=2319844 RepID=A0A494TH62_SPHPE|nr:S8 family peptidase [Sphingomonas paeninsulae]AYJ86293.1 peptidase S8 [Sphingomonas paeninsulae]
MLHSRALLSSSALFSLLALTACGGSGGTPVASTPPPPVDYNTDEYKRSNAAVQAQALAAYQAGSTGAGVTVGVIDSGVDTTSAEFTGRISSLSADLAGSRGLQDESGHGSAVSDVLLGAKNDVGISGIAFAATLLVLRTDTPGSCATATVGAGSDGCTHSDTAIARGLDLAVTARARVVNISLGGEAANSNLRAAIDRATAAGVIIVISAGNEGKTDPGAAANPDPLAQIAIDPIARGLVLIAGATNAAQTLADFSNKAGNSSAFYLTALGVSVRANNNNNMPFLWSGTSFSAPVISGAIALLAQAFPTLTPAQIVDLLLRTATDLGAPGVDSTYGHGELNLAKAFAPQGSLSLANATVPVSLTNNGTLSTAMGDSGQGNLGAAIHDGYGRGYSVDLGGTLRGAPRANRLTGGLDLSSHTAATASGPTTIALSIAGATDSQPLRLSGRDAEGARALAASVVTRIDAHTQFALGFAQGSNGLTNSLTGQSAPAFLVSDGASGSRGFDLAPKGAFAVRRRLGGIGFTLAAESGDVRLWEVGDNGPTSDRYRRYGYGDVSIGIDAAKGPLSVTGRLSHMSERDTVLGARFSAALGGGGATSWFADTQAALKLSESARFNAGWRRGWTQVASGSVRAGSTLMTQAMSFDFEREAVLKSDDSIAIRWSEPLRVTSGSLALTGLGEDTVQFGLAPVGHERDLEGVYFVPIGPGQFTGNVYWRQQPGNYAAAPDDLGAAIRYTFGF